MSSSMERFFFDGKAECGDSYGLDQEGIPTEKANLIFWSSTGAKVASRMCLNSLVLSSLMCMVQGRIGCLVSQGLIYPALK
jgi:hypothetical protein